MKLQFSMQKNRRQAWILRVITSKVQQLAQKCLVWNPTRVASAREWEWLMRDFEHIWQGKGTKLQPSESRRGGNLQYVKDQSPFDDECTSVHECSSLYLTRSSAHLHVLIHTLRSLKTRLSQVSLTDRHILFQLSIKIAQIGTRGSNKLISFDSSSLTCL